MEPSTIKEVQSPIIIQNPVMVPLSPKYERDRDHLESLCFEPLFNFWEKIKSWFFYFVSFFDKLKSPKTSKQDEEKPLESATNAKTDKKITPEKGCSGYIEHVVREFFDQGNAEIYLISDNVLNRKVLFLPECVKVILEHMKTSNKSKLFFIIGVRNHFRSLVLDKEKKQILHYDPLYQGKLNEHENEAIEKYKSFIGDDYKLIQNQSFPQRDGWSCAYRSIHFFKKVLNGLTMEQIDAEPPTDREILDYLKGYKEFKAEAELKNRCL